MNTLPDIKFSPRKAGRPQGPRGSINGRASWWPDNNYDHNAGDPGLWPEEQGININPNNLGPIEILRAAFQKYIVDTAIESNTIGLQIIYKESPKDDFKSMFITRRQYPDENTVFKQEIPRVHFLKQEDFTNPNVFKNNQITPLLNKLRTYNIKSIILVEIYHDEPNLRARWGPYGYRPHTIPIKVLFNKAAFFARYDPNDICGICQSELRDDNDQREVCINEYCQHAFHCDCINQWFQTQHARGQINDKCPVCKKEYIPVPLTPGQIADLPEGPAPDAFGKSSFGKNRFMINLNKDIKYLNSILR